MTLRIYGASDDLVEVEGDVDEEFSAYTSDDTRYVVATSTGHALSIRYDEDGCWRISQLGGPTPIRRVHEGVPDGDYSDIVEIEQDVEWVAFGGEFARRRDRRPA